MSGEHTPVQDRGRQNLQALNLRLLSLRWDGSLVLCHVVGEVLGVEAARLQLSDSLQPAVHLPLQIKPGADLQLA